MKMKIPILIRTLTVALLVYCTTTTANAQFEWANNLGGSGLEDTRDMIVDEEGNSYVVGEFNSADATFGNFILEGKGNFAQPDVFVVKYNTNGEAQWATSFQGNKQDQATSIDLDAQGNIYVTGMFKDSIMIGDSLFITPQPNLNDSYIAKLDNDGNFIWAQVISGILNNSITDIAVSDNGEFYICGTFLGTINLSASLFTATGNNENTFVAKYNSNGEFVWLDQQFGTSEGGQSSLQHISEVAISSDGLGIYTAGWFKGTVTWGGTGGTIVTDLGDQQNPFLAKYDSDGNIGWVKRFGAYRLPVFNSEVKISDLVVKSNGDPILLAEFGGGIIFNDTDTVETESNTKSSWHYESFLVSYNSVGEYQWRSIITGDDAEVVDMAIDGNDNIYLTGTVDGDIDFGAIQHNQQTGSPFAVKFNSSGTALSSITTNVIGDSDKMEIGVDGDGNMYISGSFVNEATFEPHTINSTGLGSIYLAKTGASTNIENVSDFVELGVFPNPTTNRIWFDGIVNEKNQTFEVSIFSVAGNVVLSYSITPEQLNEGLVVKSLNSGYYTITLSNSSVNYQTRFIIE